MTYSIIPPLLVVLSLIGILLFLIKKAPQVALLDQRRREEDHTESPKGFLVKVKRDGKENFKQRFLIFLEKITRKFKVLFLKLENTFNSWNESIRNKRKEKISGEDTEFREESILDSEEKIEIAGDSGEFQEPVEFKRVGVQIISNDNLVEPSGRSSQAMVSKKVAKPKVELKDRFERILIDRIATNPKDIEAYERLGEYYMEIENWQYAKECFKQVIKLDSTNNSAKARMRRLERLLGK